MLVLIEELDDEPQNWEDPQWISPQVYLPYGGNAAKAIYRWAVGIPASWRGDSVGSIWGGGYICPLPPEHHRPVYRDPSDTGAIYGVKTAARSTGDTAVVGSGRSRPRPKGREDGGVNAGGGYGGRRREEDGYVGEWWEGGVRGKAIRVNESDRVM